MAKHARSLPIESVARVVERLAVLLGAGVAPASAWEHLAAIDACADAAADSNALGEAGGVVHAVTARGAFGSAIADAIAAAADVLPSGLRQRELTDAWRALAAAWYVATESGAPVAASLRSLAGAFRSLGDIQRDLEVAIAAPAATVKMVMLLPIVGVLFGVGLGFDVLGVLFGTGVGLGCLAVGGALMFVANRWSRAMISAANPKSVAPGLLIDLMAIAMAGGGSLQRASQLVREASARYGVDGGAEHEAQVTDRVLALAQRAGVPAVELLRSEARHFRREARSNGQRAAAALAVRLMLPLAICVLPAFMAVGVAPLLMAVLSSTVSSF